MFTKADYFGQIDYGCGYRESEADWRAQTDVDEISAQLDRVLKWQGCEMTRYSEWYYSHQCHGLDAGPTGYNSWWNLRPCKVEPGDMQMWCDYDFMRSWQRRYYRLHWLADTMERYEFEREDLDYRDIDDEAFDYLYNLYDRLYTHVMDAYEEAYEEAIEDLCHTAEKLMEDCCDYAYSDEAAEEWCKFKNDEEEWEHRQQAERDFEDMVGLTAKYEKFAT